MPLLFRDHQRRAPRVGTDGKRSDNRGGRKGNDDFSEHAFAPLSTNVRV
jgi:hypothetical protein